MAAWSQILQIVGNSTLFYLSFDTHDSPGSVFIWKSKFTIGIRGKFESNLPYVPEVPDLIIPLLFFFRFLVLSTCLWYNFLKAWKGDPGIIKVTEDQRYRQIIELAERSTDKNPFDVKVFCCTCLVKRPVR